MKLYQLFFVTALFVHASFAASVHRVSKDGEHQVFTSELADAYEFVVPKSMLDDTQDDEETDAREDDDVKIAPSIYESESEKLKSVLLKTEVFHKEDQVPVAVVSDSVIVTKKSQSDYKNSAFKELDKKEDPKDDKKVYKNKEINKQEDKKDNKNETPLKEDTNSKPTENESVEKPIKLEVKPQENKLETQVVEDKDVLEKPHTANEQVKQNGDIVGEAPSNPPPNPIQVGISTIQSGLQTIGQNFASLFRPQSGDTSPPPNIFQSFQQTLQNIVRPTPVESDSVGTPPTGIVQQGLQSFQETIQTGINNLSQSFTNFINRPANDPVDGDSTTSPPNILQLAVTNLQQGVQQGLSSLNTTLINVFRPQTARPGIIQVGLTNFQEGVQNISTGLQGLFTNNATSEGNPPNIIQQSIQNLSASLQNGVESINQTIQNAINPVQSNPTTTQRYPTFSPVIPQGINIIRDGLQNALNKTIAQVFQNIVSTSTDATPTSTTAKVEENVAIQQRFQLELDVLNNTLQDGIKNITGYIETISQSNEPVQTTTLNSVVTVEEKPQKDDKNKVDHNNTNTEENTVDHKIEKHV